MSQKTLDAIAAREKATRGESDEPTTRTRSKAAETVSEPEPTDDTTPEEPES